MGKTLYISDLDGTLLGENVRISKFTADTINSLIRGGMLFTFATARSVTTAKMVTEGLDIRLPVILNNGVFIADYSDGNVRHSSPIGENTIRLLLDTIEREKISALVYSMIGGRERVSWLLGRENEGIRSYVGARSPWDKRLRPVETHEQLAAGDIFYITIIEGKERAHVIHRSFAGLDVTSMITNDIYARDEWWVELYGAGVSKGAAVKKLKEMLGAGRTVCFGDGSNDLPMFRCCDEAYAMSDSVEVLKVNATAVIGSNQEDAVARWLLENGDR